MRLSVIIPVYQTAGTMSRSVASVLAGAGEDSEVILVDDGSTDGSAALCDRWAASESRVRVIHQENQGLGAARNAALDVCKGVYVTFVDSDDWIAPATYPPILAYMDAHTEVDIAEYPVSLRCDAGGRGERLALAPRVYSHWQDYWLGARGYAHAYACNKVFRRCLFTDIRYPVGRAFEDVWVMPLLLRQARQTATVEAGRYYYRANERGITARATGDDLCSLLDAHLSVMDAACDGRYYAHILNIALDVCHATGRVPALPRKYYYGGVKSLIVSLLGFKNLCLIHSLYRSLRG